MNKKCHHHHHDYHEQKKIGNSRRTNPQGDKLNLRQSHWNERQRQRPADQQKKTRVIPGEGRSAERGSRRTAAKGSLTKKKKGRNVKTGWEREKRASNWSWLWLWGEEVRTLGSREGKLVARRLGCCGCGWEGRLFQTLLGNRKREWVSERARQGEGGRGRREGGNEFNSRNSEWWSESTVTIRGWV